MNIPCAMAILVVISCVFTTFAVLHVATDPLLDGVNRSGVSLLLCPAGMSDDAIESKLASLLAILLPSFSNKDNLL